VMIHNAWTVVAGNADDLRDTADVLDKINGQLVDIYSARTKRDASDIVAWMGAETWMTADEAVENGFADSKTEARRVAACAFDLKAFGYKHPPELDKPAQVVEPKPEPPIADRITDELNWLIQNPRPTRH
jgi:ATP-dependent Clp protease protease subunit